MDVPWDDWKALLRRSYFGDDQGCLAGRESQQANDFFVFFEKYRKIALKKQLRSDRNYRSDEEIKCDMNGIPRGEYQKQWRQCATIQLEKTNKYMLREVPRYVVSEFEYVLGCYLEFCQKDRLSRLKKLRAAQANLPIAPRRQDIIASLAENQVLIIAGDTGCGKSTQVPQYLLAGGYERIACTQPRRIACTALARRVAFETLNEYGSRIAYQIRFERTRTQKTKMLFLTEGLLLRQLASDPLLEIYNVIIVDEVHERHLQGDFLLGLLRDLIAKRKDLRLILMSATINLELFTDYFKEAPVIQVAGRLYPIQLQYFPVQEAEDPKLEKKSNKIDPAPYVRLLHMIDSKFKSEERGDALVFLSGITEITTVAEALKNYAEQSKRWIILMLHSTLSVEEQEKVFDVAPEGVRKCVLSTNIAETSVTIDGIRFVIDSGRVKLMRYEIQTRMHQLGECWVSQASAEQRKGRAGRTGPGLCYRLYSQKQFESFGKYTLSEIMRVSLESLVLQIFNLHLTVDPREFPFVEPPNRESLENAIESLKNQGALQMAVPIKKEVEDEQKPVEEDEQPVEGDEQSQEMTIRLEELTPLGKILVNLPVDVAIAKMLVMSCVLDQVEVGLTVAAGLSVQSPFTNRSYRDLNCLSMRSNLNSDIGDPFTLLNTYREWLEIKMDGSEATRQWARKRGIEEQRLYEISKLRRQFRELLEDAELIEKKTLDDIAGGVQGSAERRIRAGEMRKLRDLKRKARHEEKKRKVLKRDQHYDSIMDEAEDRADEEDTQSAKSARTDDVHALEFTMANTDFEVQSTLHSHHLNHSTATVIKMIICAGLYPQFAILDEHNAYKHGTDILAHSRAKPFLVLHPNGCLAQDPEILSITRDAKGHSANHQLIFYGLLLETTKPYICNSMRVPALHTSLLFARNVETSADMTRIICDDFVEFELNNGEQGTSILAEAQRIRDMLKKCLERKLQGESYRSRDLLKRLVGFTCNEVVFGVKRVINPCKILLREGLHVGEIADRGAGGASAAFLSTKWTCEYCGEDFISNPAEKIHHMQNCNAVAAPAVPEGMEEQIEEKISRPPGSKEYFCPDCAETLWLTAVNILKHKRSHSTG